MSTEQIWQTDSTDLKATLAFAAQIGRKLRGGEVIVLQGDLGSGKTAFTTGLAQGMGSTDHVTSPSFTLNNQYQSKNLTLHHFDFYRLSDPGIMREALAEVITDPAAVVVIEWGDSVTDILPAKRLLIQIKVTNVDSRQFIFNFPKSLQYLTDH